MNHTAVHDSRDNTSTVFSHFQGDAHRFVGVLLELNESYARDVLQLATVIGHVIDLIAAVEVRLERWRCDAERLLAVDFSRDHVMCVQQSLLRWKGRQIED